MESSLIKLITTILIVLSVFLGACQDGADLSHVKPRVLTDALPSAATNIVLISIDTLRADHLGSYGFPDSYCPTLDRLAQLGSIRETMWTVIPHTTPAHASLLTGLYPVNHGSRDNAFPINPDVPTLAESLLGQGYTTVGSVGHFLLSGQTSGLNRGFQRFFSPREPASKPGKTAEGKNVFPVVPNAFRSWGKVNSHAKNWLETVTTPWFLFLHYYECHAPHTPPEPWNNLADYHLYDGEIAGIDNAIADVLRLLAATNQLDNTEIIIVADHGESLGEHGYYGHGRMLYNPSMGVPWITWSRKGQSGVITGLSRIVDIMPTILANRKIPLPDGLDGIPGALGVKQAFGESPSLYAREPQRRIRCIRDDSYTLIRSLNPRKLELYDRQVDHTETMNIQANRPHVSQQLEQQLDTFMASDNQVVLRPEKNLKPGVMEALKSLGYLK